MSNFHKVLFILENVLLKVSGSIVSGIILMETRPDTVVRTVPKYIPHIRDGQYHRQYHQYHH